VSERIRGREEGERRESEERAKGERRERGEHAPLCHALGQVRAQGSGRYPLPAHARLPAPIGDQQRRCFFREKYFCIRKENSFFFSWFCLPPSIGKKKRRCFFFRDLFLLGETSTDESSWNTGDSIIVVLFVLFICLLRVRGGVGG
jgi:hypothetical protein